MACAVPSSPAHGAHPEPQLVPKQGPNVPKQHGWPLHPADGDTGGPGMGYRAQTLCLAASRVPGGTLTLAARHGRGTPHHPPPLLGNPRMLLKTPNPGGPSSPGSSPRLPGGSASPASPPPRLSGLEVQKSKPGAPGGDAWTPGAGRPGAGRPGSACPGGITERLIPRRAGTGSSYRG